MRISDWSSDVCSSDLGPARLRQAKMHLAADLFVRPVADREIGPPLRICRGDRPVRLADRKAPPGLVVAEGGPCAMHAERVARLGRRRRMPGCYNLPGKHLKPQPAHADLCGGFGAGATSSRSEEHTSTIQSLIRTSHAI